MIYSYLFEAKSIQSYLFRTGKLKDVIAASERLDLLVDDNDKSVLAQVLAAAKLDSDLVIKEDAQPNANKIRFIRCKGAAFYALCQTQEPLLQLRNLWTLTLQQLFPSLEFADALSQAESAQHAVNQGRKQLNADRHSPTVKFPIATAITERNNRTGAANQWLSTLADVEGYQSDKDYDMDADTDLHRQAYKSLQLRHTATLQKKFTPEALHHDMKNDNIAYPIDLEKEFHFGKEAKRHQGEAIKDIALIHIDGNGLGNLLQELQDALKETAIDDYCRAFRQFSNALTDATTAAARHATQWLYDEGKYQLPENIPIDLKKLYTRYGDDCLFIPMRPLVIGGDDVTLLCRAHLAFGYAQRFCSEFKRQSEMALQSLYADHLKNVDIKPYLSASGGVFFHKAGHPFTYSHDLVEDLCLEAKRLTKSFDDNSSPAALAFYRLSNAVSAQLSELKQQSQRFEVQDKTDKALISLGYQAYLVEAQAENTDNKQVCFADIAHCVELTKKKQCSDKEPPLSIAKWRQMATQLALGNKVEADRIYQRAIERCSDKQQLAALDKAMRKLAKNPPDDDFHGWYWTTPSGDWQTVIADLLVVAHFNPEPSQNDKQQQKQQEVSQ